MIIWALDLATASGSTYGRPDTTPYCTTVRAPAAGETLGLFGAFYINFFTKTLHALAKRLEPGEEIAVFAELPILPPKRWDKKTGKMAGGTTLATTRRLHFLGTCLEGVCILVAEDLGIKITVEWAHVSQLKKQLGGSGSASKADMVFAARKCGISLPPGAEAKDAADSFACFLYGVQKRAPQFYDYWLKRLYGSAHHLLT